MNYSLETFERSGNLGEEWRYSFHGKECRFRNLVTGQVVDMRLDDYENKNVIPDPYFLSQFTHTTNSEVPVSKLIKHDFHNMNRALEILESNGYLK